MLVLQTDQEVPSGHLVCNGGEYNELDLVQVYHKDDQSKKPLVAFHAGYIIYGNKFYDTTDSTVTDELGQLPDELGQLPDE